MKLEGFLLLIASGTVVTASTLSSSTVSNAVWRFSHEDALKSSDVIGLRQEALGLLPRGSRLGEAEDKLASIGFRCASAPHGLPNINAVSLICNSNGRGAPLSPQVNVVIVCRNGLVSDIEIWNIFAAATSRGRIGN